MPAIVEAYELLIIALKNQDLSKLPQQYWIEDTDNLKMPKVNIILIKNLQAITSMRDEVVNLQMN